MFLYKSMLHIVYLYLTKNLFIRVSGIKQTLRRVVYIRNTRSRGSNFWCHIVLTYMDSKPRFSGRSAPNHGSNPINTN